MEDQENPLASAGTLYVSVRHPKHPLRTFNCQGLRRLRELDKRQEIAEKRRLFYVAGTRTSERLILAGRTTKNERVSWQTWFEKALKIEEDQRQAGLWEDRAKGWQLTIVGSASEKAELNLPSGNASGLVVDLEPICEESLTPLIAATHLDTLRKNWPGLRMPGGCATVCIWTRRLSRQSRRGNSLALYAPKSAAP